MLLIECPHCGARAQSEFAYGGEANRVRPADPQQCSDEQWRNYLYIRHNTLGEHEELWQHTAGCRQWLKIRRNTQSHAIVATGMPHADLSSATMNKPAKVRP